MKKAILIIACLISVIIFLSISSCDVQKKATNQKTNRVLNEQSETITKRIGDTVRYEVPNIIYKDTTIVKKNYVTGTTQILKYNEEGNLTAAECISGFIDTIERNNRELIEAIVSKDSEKTESLNSDIILYGFIGLAFLIVIVGGAFVYFMKSQMGILTRILESRI